MKEESIAHKGDIKDAQNALVGKSQDDVGVRNCKSNVIPAYTIKAYRGLGVYLHSFLTSALDGGQWPSSCRGRFIPAKEPSVPTE